jgi:hypothetical protein
MNVKRYVVFSALAMIVLASVTLPANAQNYRGKFTLPFEARWGAVDLQPGNYTLWTDSVGAGPVIHVAGDNGTTATIMTGPMELREPTGGDGKIEISDVNGTQVVTKFTAALVGKEFSFAIPSSLTRHGLGIVASKKASIPVTDGK